MLPFGQRGDALVSVNNVERGLHKDVVCPSCQVPLVARKGNVKKHHFAHYDGNECLPGLQTVLHMRAKEIIDETKSIFVPGYSIQLPCRMRKREFNIITPQKVTLDSVWLEKHLDNIIPDVFAKTKAHGRELLVEIRVSHAVDQSKLDRIKSMNCSAIEVDLSDLHAKGYDDEVLRKRLIEQDDRKKWLHSPKINGIKDDVIMTALYETCSVKAVHERWLSLGCPAKGWKTILYYDCYVCNYVYSNNINPTREIWCGYKSKIKDYDSLLQSMKRKKQQQGL